MTARAALRLAASVVVPNLVGAAAALATASTTRPFYEALAKPPLAPPPGVFGPVWTVLYTLMGVAFWLVWERTPTVSHRARRVALGWLLGQLALNALWSPLFFGLKSPTLALAVIAALLVVLGLTIRAVARVHRVAAGLLVPYLLWVSFATYLNAGIVALR